MRWSIHQQENPWLTRVCQWPHIFEGYLIVMGTQDTQIRDIMAQHIKELISDCDLFGWDKVRSYHGVLVNQMGQGCLSWKDSEQKLKFHLALVWHSALPPTVISLAQPAPSYISSGAGRSTRQHGTITPQPGRDSVRKG